MANDLRTKIILDLTGNIETRSRQFGRGLQAMGTRGSRAITLMNRGLSTMGRGLDRLGNRYTGFIFGAGGIGTIRMLASLEARFTRLGIQAGKSADDMEKLKRQIFEISNMPDIRIDPGQLTAAVAEIVEKTGDLDFALANLKNLATAIQATGTGGLDIGGLAAEFQKMGLTKPSDVLTALDIWAVQGKQGSFTLPNMSALGSRVVTAYTAMGRTGLPAIREMGAALQVIRQGTDNSNVAATAFEGLLATLGDASKVNLLRQGGIQVFDPEALKQGQQILRPINELMVEIIKRTKGRKTLLSKVFDREAMRAFNAASSEFQRTGAVASLEKFYNVQADGKTVLADSARAARDFNASMQLLKTAWRQFSDRELTEPIKDLAGYLNSLDPGTVQRWMQVSKWVGYVAGSVIAYRKWMPTGAKATLGLAGKTALLPAAGTAAIAAGSHYTGKAIANHQIGMATTQRLKGMLDRTNVMGGGPYSHQAQLIQDELDRRVGSEKMSGELKITIDHHNRLRVSHLESRNLDIDVDTGRTMVGPR